MEEGLLKACRENNIEEVKMFLAKKESFPLYEKDNWSPLLWAACNGNEELVTLLIEKQAHAPYLHQKSEDAGDVKREDGEDFDPFIKPKDPRKVGKYTPLHWASYKDWYKIVCKFLKKGMSPLDIDMYGNTAVHQCAAAGNLKVLETFLSYGVDVEVKNARLHSPMDLATEPATKALIKKAISTKNCVGQECGKSKFDFKNIRFFCKQSHNFYCRKCSSIYWLYETWQDTEQERVVCRSH